MFWKRHYNSFIDSGILKTKQYFWVYITCRTVAKHGHVKLAQSLNSSIVWYTIRSKWTQARGGWVSLALANRVLTVVMATRCTASQNIEGCERLCSSDSHSSQQQLKPEAPGLVPSKCCFSFSIFPHTVKRQEMPPFRTSGLPFRSGNETSQKR